MLLDKDIREPLFDFLEERFGKIRIIEEKNMGRSRADVVMVTDDAVWGIEIKSDADSYTRLERQVKDYDRFFDRNLVVVGSTHALHVSEHVPDWWGILSVEEEEGEDGADFYLVRESAVNPKLELRNKLSLLWRPELKHIQEINEMPAYKQKSKEFVIGKIAERFEGTKEDRRRLDQQISFELFERDYTAIHDLINEYRVAQGQPKRRRKRWRRRRS